MRGEPPGSPLITIQSHHKTYIFMKSKYLLCLAILLLAGVIYAAFIQRTQELLLMYREQQQIFLWDADYISGLLGQTGGFSTLVSQFLVQFFHLPWAGAIITALLTTITGMFLWHSIYRLNKNITWWPLPFLAAYLQGVCLLDMGYHYGAIVAMLCFSILLYTYILIRKRASIYYSLLTGIVFSLLLFLYVGSIATLFAICAFIYDMKQNPGKGWISSVYLLSCILSALVTVSGGSVVGFDYALWTRGYYEYSAEQGIWQSASWLAIPAIMIIAGMCRRFPLKTAVQITAGFILLVAGGLFIHVQSERRMNRDFRTLAEMMDCINREDWTGITGNRNLNYQNYLHLNYLNLALSHQGRMMTDLFRYPQKGSQSLMVGYQAYNDLNVLFSHIYYHTGVVSEALCLSFGTMIATTYGNPSLLKLLVKERLIYGDYQVAEKYISRLERTYAYREWATGMRKFLNDDLAVENDPELGVKRRCLPGKSTGFVVLDGVMADLVKVADTGVGGRHALEYAFAIKMLDKDMRGIRYLSDRYLNNWEGERVPELMQQAVVVSAEHDEDYCRSHGVTEDTVSRFMSFKQAVLNARRNNANLQAALASYKGTFWYYYLIG